MFLCDCLKSE